MNDIRQDQYNFILEAEKHTNSFLYNIQRSNTPLSIDLYLGYTDEYLYFDKYYKDDNYIVKANNDTYIRKLFNKPFNGSLTEAINTRLIHPLLIFYNRQLYPIEKVKIVFDDRNLYFIFKENLDLSKLDIYLFPFYIKYKTNATTLENNTIMIFNKNGYYKSNFTSGDTIITTTECISSKGVTTQKVFRPVNFNIPKLFDVNLMLFLDGKLYKGLEAYPLNLFKVVEDEDELITRNFPMQYVLFYRDHNYKSYNLNDKLLENTNYIEKSIAEDEICYPDIVNIPDFDFEWKEDEITEENVDRIIDEIIKYDPEILDKIIDNELTDTENKTGKEIINKGGIISLIGREDSYFILYVNGFLFDFHEDIRRENNKVIIPIESLQVLDELEFKWFHKVDNNVYSYNIYADYTLHNLDNSKSTKIFSPEVPEHVFELPVDEKLQYPVQFRYKEVNCPIYISDNNILKKITSKGELIWAKEIHTHPISSIKVDKNGNVYSSSDDNLVVKVNSNGDILWQYYIDMTSNNSFIEDFILDSNNILYVTTYDGKLIKLDENSGQELIYDNKNRIMFICIDSNDSIFFYSNDNTLTNIDKYGEYVWTKYIATPVSALYINSDNNILVGLHDGSFTILDNYTSEILNTCKFHTDFINSIALDSENNIYTVADDKLVVKMNQALTKLDEYENVNNNPISNIVIDSNDNIYITDNINLCFLIPKPISQIWRHEPTNRIIALAVGDKIGIGIDYISDFYYNRDTNLVNVRQFKYIKHIAQTNVIDLPESCKFCNNKNQYKVFLNNRRVFDFYLLINLYDNRLNKRSLVIMNQVNPNDQVDIFIIPQPNEIVCKFNIMEENGFIKNIPEFYIKNINNLYVNGVRFYNKYVNVLNSNTIIADINKLLSLENIVITKYTDNYNDNIEYQYLYEYMKEKESVRDENTKDIDDLYDEGIIDETEDNYNEDPDIKEEVSYDIIYERKYPLDASILFNNSIDPDLLDRINLDKISINNYEILSFGDANYTNNNFREYIEIYKTNYIGYIKVILGEYPITDINTSYSISINALIDSSANKKIAIEIEKPSGEIERYAYLSRLNNQYEGLESEWLSFRYNNIKINEPGSILRLTYIIPQFEEGIMFNNFTIEKRPFSSDKINILVIDPSLFVDGKLVLLPELIREEE